MNSPLRPFEFDRDIDAVRRIWQEIGWVTDTSKHPFIDDFYHIGETWVGDLNGVAECAVHTVSGEVVVQSKPLPLRGVTAVTTSRIARGQAFAQRLTAKQLALAAQRGDALAALGIFDQGFYDKLGFATGCYDQWFGFDPEILNVNHRVPTPVRLEVEDYAEVHAAMVQRMKNHGAISLDHPRMMRFELGVDDHGFGLGYRDGEELTHFLWMVPEGDHGPYRVTWLAYRNLAQLLELLGVLKSLADQVYAVRMMEPAHLHLQSLLNKPFRNMRLSRGGKLNAEHNGVAWWQMRILDVAAVVGALELPGETLRFNLSLSDPMSNYDAGWSGCGGDYLLTLGASSSAQSGSDTQHPTLTCSVNALTQLLLGVVPATTLAATTDFAAPPALCDALDRLLCLPRAVPGWDF